MRLATIETPNGPRAVVWHGEFYIDLHATDPEMPATVRELLEGGSQMLDRAAALALRPDPTTRPVEGAKLLPPIPDPHKIVCIGLNYRDHAAESGAPIPKDPVLFSKYATA